MSHDKKLFTLLIDGDNAQPALIPRILEKLDEYGECVIKRVYGDWSQSMSKDWQEITNRHIIEPHHRFNVSKGKNATDIALVIDAMDILWQYEDKIDGFCIVSSDSDFTHLATRIRKQGLQVIGFGRASTPISFQDVCTPFISTESLQSPKSINGSAKPQLDDTPFEVLLVQAYDHISSNTVKNSDVKIQLRDIRDYIKHLGFESQLVNYQNMRLFAEQVKVLAEFYPGVIEIDEPLDNKPIIHYINIESEMFKFWKAYKHADEMYKFKDEDGWITLYAMRYALNELYPQYSKSNPSKILKTIRKIEQKHSNLVEVNEYSDGEEVTHYVRIEREIDKFQRAYWHARKVYNLKSENGWLDLSPIGSTVRKLYPNYDPLTYRGLRNSKLRKVIEAMIKDYPDIIEANLDSTDKAQPQVRFKS